MIDININAIISQALAAAVQQATAPLLERIAALEAQSANRHERLRVLEGALTDRVAALENNPAIGIDTTLEKRIAALEAATQPEEALQRLDNQEWFWDKIRRFTDSAVESAIEQHCEEYDHDDMVMKHELPDMDDYVTKDDLRDEVSDAVHDKLDNATLSIRF